MTDACTHSKNKKALYISIAVNLFLIAFVLGKLSGSEFGPMSFPGGKPGPMAARPDDGRPPMMERHPPRSPFMGPEGLFTPEEMAAAQQRMQENFAKIKTLREAFSDKLSAGPVSRDEVLSHFSDVDQIMDTVRKDAQQKMADRISTLTVEARTKLAADLKKDHEQRRDGYRGHDDRRIPPPPERGPSAP